MIKKIRTLTRCVSPGGGGHVVSWKGMKKHIYMQALCRVLLKRSDYLPPVLVQEVRTCCILKSYEETYSY